MNFPSAHQDVVIVGGGIAGCAAAIRLAREGFAVSVLERELAYTDRVRGECMAPWGYLEALALGVTDTLLAIPDANFVTRLMTYDETIPLEIARERPRDMSGEIDGVPGLLCAGHVDMREGLAAAALASGATVRRGVNRITVEPGTPAKVSFEHDGTDYHLSCTLVIVADGRESKVRTELGIELTQSAPQGYMSGMLVDDGGAWNRTETTLGTFGDNVLLVMPRGNNLNRIYVGRSADNRDRLIGKGREERFLACFDVESLPFGKELAAARPVGPCGTFMTNDSWTEAPYAPGVVLMGDAAGWCNPITGQGLSIALRDARVVTDHFLAAQGAWSTGHAREYALERGERMRRIRFATRLTSMFVAVGEPDRAGRRKQLGRALKENPNLHIALDACHAGPWAVPGEAFSSVELALLEAA